MNLTSIEGEDAAARLHFLDCAALLTLEDFRGARVVDVGSGAGFPGFPILLCEPSVRLTALDSTEKKVEFLRELAGELGVEAECLAARAEELAMTEEYRESFDIAVSRAVARLNILSELCLPLVRVGGRFIAMKSSSSDEEIDGARAAIEALGGRLETVREYRIPDTDIIRRAVIVVKTSQCDRKFPRRYAKIIKSPL